MLDQKHLAYCRDHASIPELVASLDLARRNHDSASRQWLEDFRDAEKAGKNRKSIVARTVEILAAWGGEGDPGATGETLLTCPGCGKGGFNNLKAHRCKGPSPEGAPASAGLAAPAPGPGPAAILKAAQADLEKHADAIKRHIASFDRLTLANKLGLGLAAYKAHMVFAVKPDARQGIGGRGKKNSLTRESVPEGGFAGWLLSIGADLKEPAAYKYMTAVRGLGLDHTATDRHIAAELKRRGKAGEAVTLAGLIAAATEQVKPPAQLPAPPVQLTFDDYRATLKSFREDGEAVIEQAKDMPEEMRKAACARAYSILAALTGTPWQPAEEHDVLGTIDPDNLAL